MKAPTLAELGFSAHPHHGFVKETEQGQQAPFTDLETGLAKRADVATGRRPGLLSTPQLPLGALLASLVPSQCADGVPTPLARFLPPADTHQQDDVPKVGGSQQHVQIMGHLDQGIGDKAEVPSQAPSCPSHKQTLAYLGPHQRQLQGSCLEVALHGRVEEELREGHVYHPLFLGQLGLHRLIVQAPVALGQGKEGPLGLEDQGQGQGRLAQHPDVSRPCGDGGGLDPVAVLGGLNRYFS